MIGGGDDFFVFSEGHDTVHDFTAGGTDDALVIGGFFDVAADTLASASDVGGNTVLTYAGGSITLFGVSVGELVPEDDFLLALA